MEIIEDDLFSQDLSSGVTIDEEFLQQSQNQEKYESIDNIDQMIALEKKKELESIETDFQALAETMEATRKIVEEQSPLLDEIEYDIEETKNNSSGAVSSLHKAENSFWTGALAAAGFVTVGLVLAASSQMRHLRPIMNMFGRNSNQTDEADPKNEKTQ